MITTLAKIKSTQLKISKKKFIIGLDLVTLDTNKITYKIRFNFAQLNNRIINFMTLLFAAAGVKQWEKLIGKKVLIGLLNNTIVSIGNQKNISWFNFPDFFDGN